MVDEEIRENEETTKLNAEATPEAEQLGLSDRDVEMARTYDESTDRMAAGGDPTGSDIDSNTYQAKVTGDEAVGGLAPTAEQNVTEYLQTSAGIDSAEKEPVQTKDKLDRRDDHRWQLDPKSAEDYL